MADFEKGQAPGSKKTLKKQIILFGRTVFHCFYWITCVVVSGVGMKIILSITDEQLKEEPISNMKWFTPCYGTNWNYVFQTVFLFLALAHDILEWADKQHTKIGRLLRYWRDVLFNGLVVPYTCFVFCMFWSLYAIDRELVFPKVYDDVVPWWFNHCVHTNIMVMLIVETILQARRYPTNKKLELFFNGTVGVLYAVVYYSIYFFAHRWLYNVFAIMTWWQVCLFQILIWTSSYVFYICYFPINRLIHKEREVEKNVVQKNEEFTKNSEVTRENEEVPPKNGEVSQTNGEVDRINGETKNEEVTHKNGNHNLSRINAEDNLSTISNGKTDINVPPFSARSWSLKYRTMRSQFENSSL